MVGRITSENPCVDKNGVPWELRIRLSRENFQRVIQAQEEALRAWLRAESAPRNSEEKKKLMRLAHQLTVKALN